MAYGSGAGYRVDFREVQDGLRRIDDAAKALNALDPYKGIGGGYVPKGTQLNRMVRRETRIMSERVIVPAVREAGHATGFGLDAAMADTARAVNDRIPVVKVGKVNPKISGFRRTAQPKRSQARGTLAYGSEYGPKGGGRTDRAGKRGGARKGVNYYGHPRVERGRWVYWAVNSAAVTRGVIAGYRDIVNRVMDLYGMDKISTGKAA